MNPTMTDRENLFEWGFTYSFLRVFLFFSLLRCWSVSFFLLFFQHVAVFPLFFFSFSSTFFFSCPVCSRSVVLFPNLSLAISTIVYLGLIPCHDGMLGPRHQIVLCCIAVIHIQPYIYTRGNIVNTIMTSETQFFRKIYHSLYSKGLRKGYV